LRLDPNEFSLWNLLSFSHVMAGNLKAGLEANDRYRTLVRGAPVAWDSRGGLLFMAGRNEEAVSAFLKSLELDSTAMDSASRLQLVFVYADQKKFALAESTLQEYGRQSNSARNLVFQAHLEEARGRLEWALDLYRKAIPQLAAENRHEWAGETLQQLAYLSDLVGENVPTLAWAKQQQLHGEEFPAISFLEAVQGHLAASENSLQRYASACPWWTPPGLQMLRARNQMAAAVRRNDADAARQFMARHPMLRIVWMPYYEARVALLRKDYATAEHLLGRTLLLHRWLNSMVPIMHLRSPLVSLLCHFYLGQVHEATGRREQAMSEYREFLSVFDGSTTKLPQVAQARTALKRLGAQ
jgi:tetratricopeptide (TPR) repeat protein